MTRLALKSLAARPLRTALTTLAIVLGVALVSGALTLTDTQRQAADALSSASYDGTAAVVSAKTAFKTDAAQDWSLQRPTVDASMVERVRDVPGVGVAVGDVTDQNARIIGKDGKPIGDGPYFGVGFDATAGKHGRACPPLTSQSVGLRTALRRSASRASAPWVSPVARKRWIRSSVNPGVV